MKRKEMKSKSFIDVKAGIDGVQKFNLDDEGLLRRIQAGHDQLRPTAATLSWLLLAASQL
jgi:hypothetical protein